MAEPKVLTGEKLIDALWAAVEHVRPDLLEKLSPREAIEIGFRCGGSGVLKVFREMVEQTEKTACDCAGDQEGQRHDTGCLALPALFHLVTAMTDPANRSFHRKRCGAERVH